MFKVVINTHFGGFSLSDEAVKWLGDNGGDEATDYYEVRHHPLLVKCVETLGKRAWGHSAQLKVVELSQPLYRVGGYDGQEWVQTPDTIQWTDASK
jgi:hypothetical protein